jgi:hypothetical protein
MMSSVFCNVLYPRRQNSSRNMGVFMHFSAFLDMYGFFNIMQETGILRNLLLLSICALVTPGGKPKITTLSSQDVEGYRAVSMYLYENK